MVNILSTLREYFAFTTTRNKEAHYYEQPISKSRYFRGYTTTMVGAELIGIFVCWQYWLAMPWMSRILLIAVLAGLAGAWVRAISTHAKMRERLEGLDLNGLPAELLKEAAGESNFGLSLLSSVVLILIFAWAFTIAHLEGVLSRAQH